MRTRVPVKTTRHILVDWNQDKPYGFAITLCGNEYEVAPRSHGQKLSDDVVIDRRFGGGPPWNRQTYADYCTRIDNYVCAGCMAKLEPAPPDVQKLSPIAPQPGEKSDARQPKYGSTIPGSGSLNESSRTEDTDGDAPPEPTQW